jgi:hypothetical protein
MDWGVGKAKQELSRVLREARTSPQIIRTRGALVAAVLGPSDAAAYLAWRAEHAPRSFAALMAEGRAIALEEGIVLDDPVRLDRPNPLLDPAPRARPRRKASRRAR